MSVLTGWATRWGIPPEALAELSGMLTPGGGMPPGQQSEEAVQVQVRLEAAQKGIVLFRNNVGVAVDKRGKPVRFGLANDSPALNAEVKSSDLIGLRPVVVAPDDVGRTMGQFVAREIKKVGWQYKGTGREPGQLNFITIVNAMGGDACFATGIGTL